VEVPRLSADPPRPALLRPLAILAIRLMAPGDARLRMVKFSHGLRQEPADRNKKAAA
jgi:hypothetical protein